MARDALSSDRRLVKPGNRLPGTMIASEETEQVIALKSNVVLNDILIR